MLETVTLLGTRVSVINLDKAFCWIVDQVKQQSKTYVCVAPVATLVDGKKDKSYQDIVNKAGMVTPDGMPVVWLARLKGARHIERTYGPDLMRVVCDQGRVAGLKHFIYGATDATLMQLAKELVKLYPGVRIVGSYAPAYKSEVQVESQEIINQINASGADIVWVALGSPKQDRWMAMHRVLLKPPVIIGIGAAVDFIAGTKLQAPRWMQVSGLEWLFRLMCEPKRLWKRYLVGNVLFIYFVIEDLFRDHSK